MVKARGLKWAAGLFGLALLFSLAGDDRLARGQFVEPAKGKEPGALGSSYSGLKLQEDSKFRDVVNLARDNIADQNWDIAVVALQTLLDSKEDKYVQVRERDASGREMVRWTSVKFEANKLLGTLTPEGIDSYEIRYGAKAKALLDAAKSTGNKEQLAEVGQRYFHTRAGAEANDLLGTYFLDRGQYFVAALRFEKILAMPEERTKLGDLTLLKAALAYRRAGDAKNSNLAWQKLVARIGAGGLRLGDEMVPTAQLRKALEAIPVAAAINPSDWPLIRGNLTNTAQANGSPPLLDTVLWRRPLVLDFCEITGDVEDRGKEAKAQIEQALKQMEDAKDRAILPGFFPIAANNRLVYRSHSLVCALYLKDELDASGKVEGKAGEVAWKSTGMTGSLATVMGWDKTRPTVQNWFTRYNAYPGYSSLTYENSLIGTLSTDHKYLYYLDDLAVPIPPDQFQPGIWQGANVVSEVKSLVMGNTLSAVDLKSGMLQWQLGLRDDPITGKKGDAFADTHFLGAPISVGGKLYVLNEKNGGTSNPHGDAELRLICIDPAKTVGDKPHIVEPIQFLGFVEQSSRITHYPGRRLSAVNLAYGEGVLVAPTYTGELLGIDLTSRSLAWAYPYREDSPAVLPFQTKSPFTGRPMPAPMPVIGPTPGFFNWYPSAPAIAEGKVVFTAPDSRSVHCVNLRDGTPVWKKRQAAGDLYMAGVFNGKVLIVNKNRVTALNLSSGSALWSVPTGDLPSGQGVASNNVYYLPLKKGEILAIDIEKGVIKAHNRARSAGVTPGNLVFYEGAVVSQTPLEIVAYPQLVARLAQANIAVQRDPNNPEKLVDRGELLLADGQVRPAVNDLETALGLKPGERVFKRAKTRLYEALTELLLIDFDGASDRYLKDYEKLAKLGDTPREQALRQAKYYRIVGKGREAQGDLVEAYAMYKQFGAMEVHKTEGGVAGLDDPSHKVPVEIWLRGQIGSMMAKATPDQRRPLERKIAQEWKEVEARKDIGEIRYFVNMFDVPFAVGRDARIHLADTIASRGEKGSFLEAELFLEQVRSSRYRKEAHGGKALAALAKLEEKKGTPESLKLAAAYYRELGRDFADVPVRGDTTGAALFNEMASDRRFLPYLEEATMSWGSARFAARELPTAIDAIQVGFVFMPAGDLTPQMRHQRVYLDSRSSSASIKLHLVDVASNETRWTQTITTLGGPANDQFLSFLFQGQNNSKSHPNAKFRFFQAKGHLLVLQIGTHAVCLHADTGEVLWTQALSDIGLPAGTPGIQFQPVVADEDGYLEIVIWNQFNNQKTRVPIGHVAAVQASYVALVTQKGLNVVDPIRGALLWKKLDVTPTTRVFGDEDHLFLVENADAESTGLGRVLNASDGSSHDNAPDFGLIYQNRLRIDGRSILASFPTRDALIIKLYDIPTGKDVWSKTFEGNPTVLQSEAPGLTGLIDWKGTAIILNADTGAEVATSNLVKSQIMLEDVKGLHNPLLLADADRFYIALNRPIDTGKVSGGVVGNNFVNALRCAPVNGWLVALKRGEGEEKIGGKIRRRKNGEFLWHTFKPLTNQLVVLEQFENLPILLFTSRHNELINGGLGGNRWVALTQSVDKRTGKMIWDPGPGSTNSSPQYYGFTLDPRAGVLTMIGVSSTLQHYIDDGRKLPELPEGGLPTGGMEGAPPGFSPPRLAPPGGAPALDRPRPVIRAPVRIEVLPVAPK